MRSLKIIAIAFSGLFLFLYGMYFFISKPQTVEKTTDKKIFSIGSGGFKLGAHFKDGKVEYSYSVSDSLDSSLETTQITPIIQKDSPINHIETIYIITKYPPLSLYTLKGCKDTYVIKSQTLYVPSTYNVVNI